MCQRQRRRMLRVPSHVTAHPAAKDTAPKPRATAAQGRAFCFFISGHFCTSQCPPVAFFCAITLKTATLESSSSSSSCPEESDPIAGSAESIDPVPIPTAKFGPAHGHTGSWRCLNTSRLSGWGQSLSWRSIPLTLLLFKTDIYNSKSCWTWNCGWSK